MIFFAIIAMKLHKIPTFTSDGVHVVIETPKGSQNKFDYQPEFNAFILKKSLPMGTTFPFDFGFIPGTKGEDGDPLDILVIMDPPAYQGTIIECRVLGVLEAVQKEKGKKNVRNDRFVGVANCSVLYSDITKLKSLNTNMIKEIENFFIDYNKHEGREFVPKGWQTADKAMNMIRKSIS